MINRTNSLFLITVNSLETAAISALLKHHQYEVEELNIRWGEQLHLDDHQMKRIRAPSAHMVILLEINSPILEKLIKNMDKKYITLDHKSYIDQHGQAHPKRNGQTTLEQVESLIGQKYNNNLNIKNINREDIIINEREEIFGLVAKYQKNWDAIHRIRHCHLHFASGKSIASVTSHITNLKNALDDPRQTDYLYRIFASEHFNEDTPLILAQIPTEESMFAEDALHEIISERGMDHHKIQMVLVFTKIKETKLQICQVQMFGRENDWTLVEELSCIQQRRAWNLDELNFFSYCGESCYLGYCDNTGTKSNALDKFTDHLLDNLLIGNRPLLAWRSHFLTALQLNPEIIENFQDILKKKSNDINDGVKFRPATVADHNYFMPHLRHLIAPLEIPEDIRVLKRSLLSFELEMPKSGLTLTVSIGKDALPGIKTAIAKFFVHFYASDLIMVEWICEQQGVQLDTNQPTWRNYLLHPAHMGNKKQKTVSTHCGDILNFNNIAAYIFSGYEDEEDYFQRTIHLSSTDGVVDERLVIGEEVGDTTYPSRWFKKLLDLILTANDLKGFGVDTTTDDQARLLFDERARVISCVIAMGENASLPSSNDKMDTIRARLVAVDMNGSGYPYGRNFAIQELKKSRYSRFSEWGTDFMASDHSFTCLGFGDFALNNIYDGQMDTMYLRMATLVQFYLATIVQLSREVDRVYGNRKVVGSPLNKECKRLEDRIHEFRNHKWYKQVSSQKQGIELFDLMRGATTADQEFEFLWQELEDTNSLIAERNEIKKEGAIRTLTMFLVPISFFGACIASLEPLPGQKPLGYAINALSNHFHQFNDDIVDKITQPWLISLYASILLAVTIYMFSGKKMRPSKILKRIRFFKDAVVGTTSFLSKWLPIIFFFGALLGALIFSVLW